MTDISRVEDELAFSGLTFDFETDHYACGRGGKEVLLCGRPAEGHTLDEDCEVNCMDCLEIAEPYVNTSLCPLDKKWCTCV